METESEIFEVPRDGRDWVATLCIGEEQLDNYKKYSLPFTRLYCQNNDLELIAIRGDISAKSPESSRKKKLNWHKFLRPRYLI